MNDLISIIIPVFNASLFLEDCLNSIENQTYKNLEIIAINDGSTDNSLEILKSYEKRDNRFKIFSQENKGISEARNVGLQRISGKYLMYVDADDILSIDCIEYLYNSLLLNDVDIAIGKASRFIDFNPNYTHFIDEDGKEEKILSNVEACLKMEKTYWVTTMWAKLFKTSLVKDIKFPTGLTSRAFEDLETASRYIYNSKKVFYSDKIIYLYRMHRLGICGTRPSFGIDVARLAGISNRLRFFLKKNEPELIEMSRRMLNNYLNFCIENNYPGAQILKDNLNNIL